jgi:hypothetical protein
MKNAVFLDVTACGSFKNRCFGYVSPKRQLLQEPYCVIPENGILHGFHNFAVSVQIISKDTHESACMCTVRQLLAESTVLQRSSAHFVGL